MERKIGEVFEFAGLKLKVQEVKDASCDECFFNDIKCLEMVHGECCSCYRTDDKDVIFKDITDKKEEL